MPFRNALPLVLPLLVLAGCSGPSTPSQRDVTAPHLITTAPTNGATNVPTNVAVGLTFDEPMDPSSLVLGGSPPITFDEAAWNADGTAAVMTHDDLAGTTAYRLTIGAKDVAGNALAPATLDFTTAGSADTTPPTIRASEPDDGATGMSPREPRVRLTFSEPMNPASLRFTFQPRFGADDAPPDEPFEIVWSAGNDVVTIAPSVSDSVPENTAFKLDVDATDRAGNGLTGDATLTFTTGPEPPRLVSSTPEDGATGVSTNRDAVITLTFSKALDPGTFTYQTDVSCDPGTLEDGDTTLVLAECRLWDTHTYTVEFSAHGSSGGSIDGAVLFTTTDDTGTPHVSDTLPLDGATGVALEAPLTVEFDDEMDATSTLAAVSSSLPLGCTWQLEEGYRLSCTPADLDANTTYIVTVGTSATDTSGHAHSRSFCRGSFPCPYAFTFSTGATVDVTRPTVLTNLSAPAGGETDVATTATINVIFSERMDEDSAEQAFAASVAGAELPGTFGWFSSGMVFFPSPPLPACADVHVVVGTTALDRATNPLANAYDITFATVCP